MKSYVVLKEKILDNLEREVREFKKNYVYPLKEGESFFTVTTSKSADNFLSIYNEIENVYFIVDKSKLSPATKLEVSDYLKAKEPVLGNRYPDGTILKEFETSAWYYNVVESIAIFITEVKMETSSTGYYKYNQIVYDKKIDFNAKSFVEKRDVYANVIVEKNLEKVSWDWLKVKCIENGIKLPGYEKSSNDLRNYVFKGTSDPVTRELIIQFFVGLGATNYSNLRGSDTNSFYGIDNTNNIAGFSILPKDKKEMPVEYLLHQPQIKVDFPGYPEIKKESRAAFKGSRDSLTKELLQKHFKESGATNFSYYSYDAPDYYYYMDSSRKVKRTCELPLGYFLSAIPEKSISSDVSERDYTPKVGDHVIMEKAGGWGYHPDNNGCLAIISKISNRVIEHVKGSSVTYSISGKVINPKTSSSVKFTDVPQIGCENEIIFRKATMAEITAFSPTLEYLEPEKKTEKWQPGTYAVGVKGYFGCFFTGKSNSIPVGEIFTIKRGGGIETIAVGESIYWMYKQNVEWFATREEAEIFSHYLKETKKREEKGTVKDSEEIITYPITPEKAFPVKDLKNQLKIVKFQVVHEIKTVEEKLLKKTKRKLFNI